MKEVNHEIGAIPVHLMARAQAHPGCWHDWQMVMGLAYHGESLNGWRVKSKKLEWLNGKRCLP